MAGEDRPRVLSALDEIRPELVARSGQCKSCHPMVVVIDQLEALHHALSHEAGYQEYIDAPLNASVFKRAAATVLEVDTTLAKAAGLMRFSRRG